MSLHFVLFCNGTTAYGSRVMFLSEGFVTTGKHLLSVKVSKFKLNNLVLVLTLGRAKTVQRSFSVYFYKQIFVLTDKIWSQDHGLYLALKIYWFTVLDWLT